MHWVDRGEEPARLRQVRKKLTPAWVAYYRGNRSAKPTDAAWRSFQPQLNTVFRGICGYCEEFDHGQVDHFRPKSKFPALVYRWDNWILACPFCNSASKRELWPRFGYVDPCAKKPHDRPENHFDFDTKTGELIPKHGLNGVRFRRVRTMIEDLQLNAFPHLKTRAQWLLVLEKALQNESPDDPGNRFFITKLVSRESQLSSLTRKFLTERGMKFY
ncbi:MAG: HNH endonuclease [Verrucomicrobia bacterium]|nr:HNH endonuclease [Verrucomicrobiota bacterium]